MTLRTVLSTAFAFAAFSIAATQPAQASEELAKKHSCMACHAVDKKAVGPSYLDVAKKYATDKEAEAKLIAKVKAGGVGVWGQIPMPANSALKDDELKTLVKWVLATKEKK